MRSRRVSTAPASTARRPAGVAPVGLAATLPEGLAEDVAEAVAEEVGEVGPDAELPELPGTGRTTTRGVTGAPAATDAEAVATLNGLASTLPCPIMSAACSTESPEVGTLPPNAWTPRPVADP